MKEGYLNQYFSAVAVKRLSNVESDASISNQHEYNGVALLKKMLFTSPWTVIRIFVTEIQ